MKYISNLVVVVVAVVSIISCESSLINSNDNGQVSKLIQKEVWSQMDSPDLFDENLEYVFEKLPLKGEAKKIPWAGTYWPNYEDSINIRWDGEDSLSPTEKYEKAFGATGVQDWVSAAYGVGYISPYVNSCTKETEAEVCSEELGEACAIRRGETVGKCIPTWFGLCHAWAPAAILEDEPKRAVTYNGVEFKVNDIKALITYSYNRGVNVKFLSGRCNANNEAGDINYDEYGRPIGSQCRDTNPGTFHIIATNFLGIMGQSFVEDRTFDYQVWNQPVRSYKVEESSEITSSKANSLLGIKGKEIQSRDIETSVIKHDQKQVGYIFVPKGQTLKVEMTGTGDGDLYVSKENQQLFMKYVCRPYVMGSEESCLIDSETDAIYYIGVAGYKDSDLKVKVTRYAPSPSEYRFNEKAVKFQKIKMRFSYITESETGLDGNLNDRINEFTEEDVYNYILEIDESGRIIGGEWIGKSIQDHPDFLWLPTSKDQGEVDGIKWSDVQEILAESVKPIKE